MFKTFRLIIEGFIVVFAIVITLEVTVEKAMMKNELESLKSDLKLYKEVLTEVNENLTKCTASPRHFRGIP